MLRRLLILAPIAVLLGSGLAAAQIDSGAPTDAPPAHVSVVDGTASLQRDGRIDTAPLNLPLLTGDRLVTRDGRMAVSFPDGSRLLLDADTTLDVQSDSLVRLIDGRIRLVLQGARVSYRVDSAAGFARITEAGDYRATMLHNGPDTQLELDVARGRADLLTAQGTTALHPGERGFASDGLLPSVPYQFNAAGDDEFDQWAESLTDQQPDSGPSAQYLPAGMQAYGGTLDATGDWRYVAPYGYVWYPRVAAEWRPYYYGRWVSYPRYGWTWVGADRFAWPTHHYGRWGLSAGSWFWIPDTHWAPANVSWAYAPGYVSWCPLGVDDRAVMAIEMGRGGPRPAWTIVAEGSFGHGFVPERGIRVERLTTRPAFEVRDTPPLSIATARTSVVPVHSAGTRDARPIDRGTRMVPRPSPRPYAPATSPTPSAGSATGVAPRADPITMPFGTDQRRADPITMPFGPDYRRADPITMPFAPPPQAAQPAQPRPGPPPAPPQAKKDGGKDGKGTDSKSGKDTKPAHPGGHG